MARERRAGVLEKAGVLHRRRADDHVFEPVVEIALDGVQVADAAAQLHRNVASDLLDDRANRIFVLRLAGECAVQVDEMQTPRAPLDPVPGHRRRIFGKNGRLVHIALLEAYALTVFKIDGRNEQHRNRVLSGEGWSSGCRIQPESLFRTVSLV